MITVNNKKYNAAYDLIHRNISNNPNKVAFISNNCQVTYNELHLKIRAFASKKVQSKNFNNPIVTDIVKAGKFYKAEEYHQKYIKKNNDKRF